jgi:hypothetical protein
MIEHFKVSSKYIDSTDIFIDELSDNKGKITISNPYGLNFSCWWGSMGGTLKDFLLSMNEGYFINKLSDHSDVGEFDGKTTIRNVRRFIRKDWDGNTPWYKCMELQKELRDKLKEFEDLESSDSFVSNMIGLSESIHIGWSPTYDETEFSSLLDALGCEPWHWIERKDSNKSVFLKRIFPLIQKEIKKIIENKVAA